MSMIKVTDLTFCYEGGYENIFEDVSFSLDTDWKLGFTGRNGRGKTTFLKLLMGEYPYRGKITADAEFEYFPYPVEDLGEDTLEAAQRICPELKLWELKRELSKLKVTEDVLYRPFGSLSNGERTKVLLAVLFLKENRFLLIDEPTNHLDEEGRVSVGEYLNKKKGFLLVSHDRAFLDLCVDHILSINRADIQVQRGNFSAWWENRRRQDAWELAQNERLKKEVRHLQKASLQSKGWSDEVEKSKKGTKSGGLKPDRGYVGHKSAKMMKRSKCLEERRDDALREKEGLLKNIESAAELRLYPLTYHADVLFRTAGLSVDYGDRRIFEGLTMELHAGERVAVCGRNGCGKSSLLKLTAGEDIPHGGTLTVGSGLIISYVPQDTSFLSGSLEEFIRTSGVEESLFKAMLRKLDFSRSQFDRELSQYSEGQKKKVLLAGSLCRQAHLYIWDEPLNYVDILSRIQIEELIKSAGATMLLVEHDRAFLDGVGARRVFLSGQT